MTRYETPNAIRNDARTLADDARALLEATSEITDEKVAEARERLNEALAAGKQGFARIQERVSESAKAADQTIRANPYQSLAVAFGIGAVLGYLVSRRD